MAEKKETQVQRRSPAGEAEGSISPLADIYETDDELVLVAEVPGAGSDDVSIQVDRGVLTIEGAAKVALPDASYGRTYVGFVPGAYYRAFALSDEIDRDKITAAVADGVVTVHMPKASSAQSRKIEIKSCR